MGIVFPWSYHSRVQSILSVVNFSHLELLYIPLVVWNHNIVTIFVAFVAASWYTYELLLLSSWLYTTYLCILFFIITVEAQFSLKCHCRTFGECNQHYSELTQYRAFCLLTNCCIILFIFFIYKYLVWRDVVEHLESTITSPQSYLINMIHAFHAFLWTPYAFVKPSFSSSRAEWKRK